MTVSSGGTENVSAGGTASNSILESGGDENVYGVDVGTTINDGATEIVYAGGTASGTIVEDPGALIISNGTTLDTHLSGGDLFVSSGGTGLITESDDPRATIINDDSLVGFGAKDLKVVGRGGKDLRIQAVPNGAQFRKVYHGSITNRGGWSAFVGLESAGTSTITNTLSNHPGVSFLPTGTTYFFQQSDAGPLQIYNISGRTYFYDFSYADQAKIVNTAGSTTTFNAQKGGSAVSDGILAIVSQEKAGRFGAGSAKIFNDYSQGGNNAVRFTGISTAGSATILNDHGRVEFEDSSTADNSNITNLNGGHTYFGITLKDITVPSTTIENATVITGQKLVDESTAGNSTIVNKEAGHTYLANGGTAKIFNDAGGYTYVEDNADHAIITNANGGYQLYLKAQDFLDTAPGTAGFRLLWIVMAVHQVHELQHRRTGQVSRRPTSGSYVEFCRELSDQTRTAT